MHIKELKKLINQEVERVRSKNLLNEQEKTEPGRKKPQVARPIAQPEPFIEPEMDPSEERGYSQIVRDFTPEQLKAEKNKLVMQIFSSVDDEVLYKIMPSLPEDLRDDVGKLIFVISKMQSNLKTPIDTSKIPDRLGGAGLPTPTAIGRNPHLKTASINPADAPTKRTYSSVEPIGVDEPTKTKTTR
jgi:hypothetical protein